LGKKKRPQQIFFFFVSIERYPSCRHYSHRDDEKRNNAYRTPRTKEMVKRFPAYSPIGCDVLNLSFHVSKLDSEREKRKAESTRVKSIYT